MLDTRRVRAHLRQCHDFSITVKENLLNLLDSGLLPPKCLDVTAPSLLVGTASNLKATGGPFRQEASEAGSVRDSLAQPDMQPQEVNSIASLHAALERFCIPTVRELPSRKCDISEDLPRPTR